MYFLLKVKLLVTEHRQEASPRVAAMEPSRRGCLLPNELPEELPNMLPEEGSNEGNIDFLPSIDTKYTAASCRLQKKIGKMVSKFPIKLFSCNVNVVKVEQHQCIPYNLPAPPINLLPLGLNICSGEEKETAKNKPESEEECLEECQHHYFSTSMSSLTKFEDPGDFFYSKLLRRPGPASPVDSPKFWAEYVQYVNSLGNSTVLGPPRCHVSFHI